MINFGINSMKFHQTEYIKTGELEFLGHEGNHAETIKSVWERFPLEIPFIYRMIDSNRYLCVGYVSHNYLYGTVLYIAFNYSGIVMCRNGEFSIMEFTPY